MRERDSQEDQSAGCGEKEIVKVSIVKTIYFFQLRCEYSDDIVII